jgi:hypothetical protein
MTDNSQPKQRGKPFKKGLSGNPAGRPKGSRHPVALLAERLMEADVPDIIRAVVAAAINGDMVAAKIVLERLVPTRRGRPISIDLPKIECARDVIAAASRVMAAVASGELTIEEGASLTVVAEFARRAIETADLESRIAVLEARNL